MTEESGDQAAAWNRINLDVIRDITDAAAFLGSMGDTMDSASYWGEHHGNADLRTEHERRALARVIEAVLASPAMDWWSMPFEPLSQFLVADEHAWCEFEAPPRRVLPTGWRNGDRKSTVPTRPASRRKMLRRKRVGNGGPLPCFSR